MITYIHNYSTFYYTIHNFYMQTTTALTRTPKQSPATSSSGTGGTATEKSSRWVLSKFYPQSPRGSLVCGGEFPQTSFNSSSIRIVYRNLQRWVSKSLDLQMIWVIWLFHLYECFICFPSSHLSYVNIQSSSTSGPTDVANFIWCDKSREVAALIPSLPAGKHLEKNTLRLCRNSEV